jgi:hypothetical protein
MFRKVLSAGFGVVAVTLLICAALWTALGMALFGIWSAGFALFLHPKLSVGLAQGMREFRRAIREVSDDTDRGS